MNIPSAPRSQTRKRRRRRRRRRRRCRSSAGIFIRALFLLGAGAAAAAPLPASGKNPEHVKDEQYGGCEGYTGEWKASSDGGYPEGYGTCRINGGAAYTGGWKDGKFHGYGIYTEADGGMYHGEWKDGAKDGFGVTFGGFFVRGTHEGQYRNGKRHGRGSCIWADGTRYDGEFKNDATIGTGRDSNSNSEPVIHVKDRKYRNINCDKYTGQWREGILYGGWPEGYGMCRFLSGDVYHGEWKDGMRHGTGIAYDNDGATYLGKWEDNKYNGQGIYTWADGRRYEGNWKNGLRDGLGTATYSNGDSYEGQFRDDQKNGQGIYTWADGSRYEGQFRDDQRNGQGIYTWADGRRYEGQFRDDQKNGQGIYTSRGWEFQDEYKADRRMRRVGPAILFLGSPGVGKSTIINTLLGESKAPAGQARDGLGITKETKQYNITSGRLGGVSVVDTAGWEDPTTQEQAVSDLRRILRDGRQLKVVFVKILQRGRINTKPIHDFIKAVRGTDVGRFRFGVIVNMAKNMPANNMHSVEQLLSYHLDTEGVMSVQEEGHANFKDNAQLSLSAKTNLEDFIENLPATDISWAQISDLKDILMMADACSLIYFYTDLLSSGGEKIRETLSKERATFSEVISTLEATPTDQRNEDFEQNFAVLKARYDENNKKEATHKQSPGWNGGAFLSCVGQADKNGGLVYTVTVSPGFKRITVTFRGSTTTQDWLKNIQFLHRTVKHEGPHINVHRGFQVYLDEKYADIKKHLDKLKKNFGLCDLYVTGHSLGGAIATLFAYRYANEVNFVDHRGPLNLVTFASPHVGDGSFAAAFKKLEKENLIRHTRVAISSDPVPKGLALAPYLGMLLKAGFKWYESGILMSVVFQLIRNQLPGPNTDYNHVGNIFSLECSESLAEAGLVEKYFHAHSVKTYTDCVKLELGKFEQQQHQPFSSQEL